MTNTNAGSPTIKSYRRDGSVAAEIIVDHATYEWAKLYRWSMRNGYAYRAVWLPDEKRSSTIYMHREIMNLTAGDGRMVDHINRDRLDNRTANLRLVTPSENSQNMSNRSPYGFRGVSRSRDRYRAAAMVRGVKHHLGVYDTAEEAGAVARAWREVHMPYATN